MAKRNIKGITIEIDGNATPLQKALGDVDKSLKNTQNQIKDVNKLLKFDPGNSDLLKQKQELLADSIKGTKDRLNELKQAQKEASDQLASGQIGQEQYDALQREITETEQKLKNLETQYKDFGSVAKQQVKAVGDKMQELGGKVSSVGDAMTKNITGPIAAIGGASIAAFKSVDDGYDEMIKKTGATGEEADKLRETMNNIATSIPTDFTTAGNAIGEVATRFGASGDQLEELSSQFIKFADLNNTDVVQSIDSVQSALAAYGLGAEDAGAFLDRLNVVSQQTGADVNKLADYVVTNASSFKEMGLGIDEAVTFMGQLDKTGLDVNQVMGGLRKAMKQATKEGKPMNEALAELQESLLSGEDAAGGMMDAYELFGTKSAPMIADAVKEGRLNFEDLTAAVTDAGGSVSSTFEETRDPIDQFKETLNMLKVTLAEVAGPLLEILTPAIQKLAEIITTLKEKWESLTPEQQAMIEKAVLIAAALGPVVSVVGRIISGIGVLTSALAFLASPVGIVVAAIAALIAIGVLLYKSWDEIKAKAEEIWGAIKEFVSGVVEKVKDNIVNYFTEIRDFWVGVWDTIKEKAVTAVQAVRDNIVDYFTRIYDFWTGLWEKVKNFFTDTWDAIKEGASEKAESVKTAIQNALQSAIDWLENLPERALNWGRDMIQNFVNGIWEKASAVWDAVSNLASGVDAYIGFSEPDKGPLSKFHTFAPDMLKLFAQGIEKNKNVVFNAMDDLAEGMNITGQADMQINGDTLAVNPNMSGITAMLAQYLPYLAQSQDVYLDSGALVGGIADQMNRELGQIQVRERRR